MKLPSSIHGPGPSSANAEVVAQLSTRTRGEAEFHMHSVSKIYQMGEVQVHALRSVELDLYAGEFVVFLGPSGSGKSTLLNIMGALDTPTSGEVFFRDHNLTGGDDKALTRFRREHVGFVFQFYNLIPSLTALENVTLVTEIAERPMPAEEALRMVALSDRMHHFPAQLSGGEQQRVAIARALATRPAILLADEPTGNLDSKNSLAVLDILRNLNDRFGQTILMITHSSEAAEFGHRIVYMSDGRIVDRAALQKPEAI